MKPAQAQIERVLEHPLVRTLDPRGKHFIEVRLLSDRLNPFANYGIKIGAAIAFAGLPHIKTVAAWGMLWAAFLRGDFDLIDTLVVPSSGNTGHAVALLAPIFGLKVIVVMASDTPEAKKSAIMGLASAEAIYPRGGQSVGERALEEASRPGRLLLDQYDKNGEDNTRMHEECTGPELLYACGDKLAVVAAAMGSAGTVVGISRYLRKQRPDIKIIGVRPKHGERLPGARDDDQMKEVTVPWQAAIDQLQEVGRKPSFIWTRLLWSEISPQPGPSSGGAYLGLLNHLALLPPDELEALRGKLGLFICADDGRFYSGPIFSELDPDQGLMMLPGGHDFEI